MLAETLWASDAEVARRHGVAAKSLKGWRKALGTDDELAALYADACAVADGSWRHQLADTAAQTARDLAQVQARLHALVMDVLDHPEAHADEHGQTPTTVDRIRLATDLTSSLRATLETSAELLTHYAAVVDDEPTHGADREDHATPEGGPSGAPGPRPN